MIIDENILKELQTGDGHMGEISFSRDVTALARREGTIEILKTMKAVNVVHIGCCGHFHNIKKQVENHSHFHAMLIQNFKNVIGFDIEEKSVEYLSSFGIADIYAKDFVEDTEEVKDIISVSCVLCLFLFQSFFFLFFFFFFSFSLFVSLAFGHTK